MNVLKNAPDMIKETKKAKFLPHGVLEVLIFVGIMLISQIMGGLILGLYYIFKILGQGGSIEEFENLNESDMMLGMLYITSFMIIMVIIYSKFIQKRSLFSIGFGKKHALKDYLVGYGVGTTMFSLVVFILVTTNHLEFEKATLSVLPMVLLFFFGFLIQGASEEIALRGYLMNALAARHNLIVAIIVNSSIFGVLHLTNPNVTVLSILNIILFGLFASFYALKFNNIWGVCALHSAWNFVQGNIYGLEVSGLRANQSLWYFKRVGNEWLNGGSFGPEGGLVTSFVLIFSIIVVLLININRNQNVEEI